LEAEFLPKHQEGDGDSNNKKKEKRAPSDIVPVTGLILSKLHRTENELKTVYHHWGPKLNNSSPLRNPIATKLLNIVGSYTGFQ